MEQQQDYTVEQVAAIVQVNRRSVENWIRNGELDAYEFGGRYRIRPEALDEFRAKRKVQPRPRRRKQGNKGDLALAG